MNTKPTKRSYSRFCKLIFSLLTIVILLILFSLGKIKIPKFDRISEIKLPKLTGIVDDCCCSVENVQQYNKLLSSTLDKLVKRTFFKYFKVNYLRECPFWAENYICELPPDRSSGGCGVCECDDSEIPEPWKKQDTRLDRVDTTLGKFNSWQDENDDVWTFNDPGSDGVYLNLELNPERFTGYGGFNSTRIWMAIYKENCFPGTVQTQCFEERVFYRLISGFHGSTTAHLCRYYQYDQVTGVWKPQLDLFEWRLGHFPDRIKNIYFTFVFLLRAVIKISDILVQYDLNTGNPNDDNQAKQLVHQFVDLKALQTCAPIFNESNMFQGAEKQNLKKEFKKKFQNISEIMDCVACESCKVHAKLQMLGIGTALKILLSEQSSLAQKLQRNEIIALINTLQKFSDSITSIEYLINEVERKQQTVFLGILTLTVIILLATYFIYISCFQTLSTTKVTTN
eukprot:TRINITY_DN1240_c2_g1_i1.p1 TRINITY_DN1240_c2_g1~~TRINITY_DN1240_c2_g1_i1.p1  ORF type:complete len:454 (-),score=133.63 TRINITY_DN1240_c2_g1_i1:77-1438(-)